ncbi:MFS transporter [Muribaculum intestinale]|uniref:MFS transporter n=3 Tax=Muribaculum intestinale TaxID=1796646 RepID=A0A1B1S6T2_9BACT|nr:MFS transporter [Muribaculum intestinale]ANU62504.1 MFS transporter [Muribaculum intestinale]ASB37011.1 MFS transporter [Muribaculum intestinale]PWB00562.1 MFS transporter [Muribaculum intestinale]PWB07344.1 MFS transporter [Muribaculum intestinale]QQR10171.1 MFS transporter [Muribaculum intestinale]
MNPTSLQEESRTAFRILFAISIAHLLNDMVQSIVPSIYPIIKEEMGLSFIQIGVITLVFQLTSSLLQPFVGMYADRRPSPYALAAGMCFTLTGLIWLAFTGSYAAMLGAVSVIGIGSSIFHPEASRVAQLAAGGKKGLAQSIFQVGGNGGTAIGPLLAALIVLPHGRLAVLWFALAAIMGALILTRVGRWYKRVVSNISGQRRKVRSVVDHLSKRRINMALAVLVVLTFSKQFYLASMTSYFTFFLIDKFGVSIQYSQIALFAFLAASAVGIIAGGYIGDKIGRKYVIWGSILGAAPFAIAMPYAGLTLTIILAIIVGLVISSAFSAILVYATELKPGKVGMIAGLFFGLSFGLGGVGAAFFGWLADIRGIYFVFEISTLLPLLGIVAAFLPDLKKIDKE